MSAIPFYVVGFSPDEDYYGDEEFDDEPDDDDLPYEDEE